MKRLLAVGAAALCGCATLTWPAPERALFAFDVGCHAVDYAQTTWAIDHGLHEANPLLGDQPSDSRVAAVDAAGIGLAWGLAAAFPRHRAAVLVAATAPCLIGVVSNYAQGARP